MKFRNLPVIAVNIGLVVRNRTAKVYRHVASRTRRAAKRSGETAKNTATHVRQTAERGRDEVLHVHAAGVRTGRYWSRVRRQLLDPIGSDLAIKRDLRAVAGDTGPIVVGPWLSEVGYEVLYWVPFVRWFVHHHRVDPSRLVVVSRGGTSAWYADIATNYVELLELFEPDDFARRNRERQAGGDQKQLSTGEFDREILTRLESGGLTVGSSMLHPSLMFRLLRRFWLGNASLEYVADHLRFAPLGSGSAFDPAAAAGPVPTPLPMPALPDRYTAVKFYTGTALPDTAENRTLLRAIVEQLARRGPVVALDTGLRLDEHEDYLFRDVRNVFTLGATLGAAQNLAVQTEVIRRASLFVGTCGSLAWLAPMLGVDTVAIYADDHFLAPHLYAARHAFASMPAGRFMPTDLRAAAHLGLVAAAAERVPG